LPVAGCGGGGRKNAAHRRVRGCLGFSAFSSRNIAAPHMKKRRLASCSGTNVAEMTTQAGSTKISSGYMHDPELLFMRRTAFFFLYVFVFSVPDLCRRDEGAHRRQRHFSSRKPEAGSDKSVRAAALVVWPHLWVWQLGTYMFPHGVFHILFNMLALWMFVIELNDLGTRYS
jgi:hypothetical protein